MQGYDCSTSVTTATWPHFDFDFDFDFGRAVKHVLIAASLRRA
jgi:hypothetical protein